MKSELKQPPIGIIPLFIHNEKRLKALNEAISRYKDAECKIPDEWLTEKSELEEYINKRTNYI